PCSVSPAASGQTADGATHHLAGPPCALMMLHPPVVVGTPTGAMSARKGQFRLMRLSDLPLPDAAARRLSRLPFVSDPSPADTNRRVLITGGASGLGLALATAILERGDRVMIADRAPADSRPASIPEDARYLRLDVRSEDE